VEQLPAAGIKKTAGWRARGLKQFNAELHLPGKRRAKQMGARYQDG